jgi:hypothetical protein
MSVVMTGGSYALLQIKDQGGTLQWQDTVDAGLAGTNATLLIDAVFTATGSNLVLSAYNDLFKGTVQMVKVASLSGALPGRRFYVSSLTGSNSNTGLQAQSAATPLASLATALNFAQNGRGDQILIAEGSSFTGGLPNLMTYGGLNATYPFVIQSYDPADPTNEAKLGRAAGNNRPAFNTSGIVSQTIASGAGPQDYHAIRGIRFAPPSTPLLEVKLNVPTSGTSDYWLFENSLFPYTALIFDNVGSAGGVKQQKIIVRNCALYQEYGDHSQGIYAANTDGITIEDNVFWANGRLSGVSRDASQATGGASIFNHPIYLQSDTINSVVRRNVFIDTATDGGNLKGGGTYTQNLVIRCANAFSFGGGDNYSVDAPNGIVIDGSYNAVIGSNIVNSTSGAVGWGAHTNNGKQSQPGIHHNVLARNDQATGYAWMADAAPDITNSVALPNYTDFHDNVSYLWNPSGQSTSFTPNGSLLHATISNTKWDDPTSGTNTNVGSVTFPNAYTETSLLSALGYASETAAINDWIANPEQHGWRLGPKLMLQGYGVDISAMPYLG